MDSFRQIRGLEAMDSFRQIRGGQQCIFPQILVKIKFAIHGICPYIAMLLVIMGISSKSIRPEACLITWSKRSTRTGPTWANQNTWAKQNTWATKNTGGVFIEQRSDRNCFHPGPERLHGPPDHGHHRRLQRFY